MVCGHRWTEAPVVQRVLNGSEWVEAMVTLSLSQMSHHLSPAPKKHTHKMTQTSGPHHLSPKECNAQRRYSLPNRGPDTFPDSPGDRIFD